MEDCTTFAVSTGKRWRDPSAAERVAVFGRMWEDVIYVDAFTMIHGRQRAIDKVRQMRGYP